MSAVRTKVWWDPFLAPAGDPLMEFRLTYEGELVSAQDDDLPTDKREDRRRFQKHHLRRNFHPQLKYLWETHPYLQARLRAYTDNRPNDIEVAAETNKAYGYRYVPLVEMGTNVLVRIDILFLRRQKPGGLVIGGDLDNRLKTLYDGLRMPKWPKEMADVPGPQEGEDPFFVLLEDDSLITHSVVETDMLMDYPKDQSDAEMNRVRLVLTVNISPYGGLMNNLGWA